MRDASAVQRRVEIAVIEACLLVYQQGELRGALHEGIRHIACRRVRRVTLHLLRIGVGGTEIDLDIFDVRKDDAVFGAAILP